MHNFIKLFYGLLFILICSSDVVTVENVKDVPKNNSVPPDTVDNIVLKPSVSNVPIAAEGGSLPPSEHDGTHSGREHVSDKSNLLPNTFNNATTKAADILEGKPVTESPQENQGIGLGVPSKNDNTEIVARKGAPVENSTYAVANTTTELNVTAVTTSTSEPKVISIVKPKKPRITEHAPSPKSNAHDPNTNNDNILDKKISNRADYVIPIVAVILSVPLVAVIISVLYKRGTYWWQHRNYRRMDFLIEGMYNN